MSNDLPPLPEPDALDDTYNFTVYSAEAISAYATAAVAAYRARHRLDVHSCHPGCAVAGCVNERLRAELAEAKRALQQATEQTQQHPVP